MKMTVEMIDPQVDERVLDSSCGTGGFLVQAMTHTIGILEKQYSESLGLERSQWDADATRNFKIELQRWQAIITLVLTLTQISLKPQNEYGHE